MKSVPVHRISIVRSFTQFLAEVGTPIEHEFKRVNLPYYALENVNNYIPSHKFWLFLVNTSHNEGINDLGFRVGQQFGSNSLDPKFERLIKQSPSLYQGILESSAVSNRTVTNCHIGIYHRPNHSYYYHKPSCAANNPAVEHIGWFGLMTMLSLVRAYTGTHWQPSEIGVMTDNRPDPYIREMFPDSVIKPSQKFSYITLENKLLSLPPLNIDKELQTSQSEYYLPFHDNFSGLLEQLLLSYIQENKLDINFLAELCNMSKRTLQRNLNKEGSSFSKILAHARYKSAKEMLLNTNLTICKIGNTLGFKDSSNFARAFHQYSGVSPNLYRKLHVK